MQHTDDFLQATLKDMGQAGWHIDYKELSGTARLGPPCSLAEIRGKFMFTPKENQVNVSFTGQTKHPFTNCAKDFLVLLCASLLEEGVELKWNAPSCSFSVAWTIIKPQLYREQSVTACKEQIKALVWEGHRLILSCGQVLDSYARVADRDEDEILQTLKPKSLVKFVGERAPDQLYH